MRHFVSSLILQPRSPVPIHLVGCGGTGSQVLTGLTRLNHALKALGHNGLHVSVIDPDFVTEANIGRQSFSPADIGQYKAVTLVTRVNQYMGLSWQAYPYWYHQVDIGGHSASIVVTAVDTAAGRIGIGKLLRNRRFTGYWLDIGNTQKTGQVVLGSLGCFKQPEIPDVTCCLPTVTDLYDLSTIREADTGPSCSLAAALEHQDLMINPMMANCAVQLLWQAFRHGVIQNHGCFVDLGNMKVSPLPINKEIWYRFNPDLKRKGRRKKGAACEHKHKRF